MNTHKIGNIALGLVLGLSLFRLQLFLRKQQARH